MPQQTASTCVARRPGHERHQVERRRADAVPALLAGRVVGHGEVDRPEVGPQLAALVQQRARYSQMS